MQKSLFPVALILAFLALPLHSTWAQDYYFEDWTPRSFEGFSSYQEQAPPSEAPTATVTVNYADTLAIVPRLVFGNNAVSWQQASHTVPERVRHYRNANLSVLRFPGGNLSSAYFWDAPFQEDLPDDIGAMYPNSSPGEGATANYEWWRMTPDDYYALLDSLGAEGVITVNYGYARYGTSDDPVSRAAQYAAEWVHDANIERGLGITYWEVGNEMYGSWQAGYEVPGKGVITGDEYGRDFCVFADAMKAVDPTIKVGAVTRELPSGWNNDYNQWNQRMFPEIADCADYLIVHSYFGPFQPTTMRAQNIISAVDWVDDIATYVRAQWQTITGKEPIPLAMTEFNVQTEYTPTADNRYFAVGQLSSLAFALTFGKLIENKYALATAWDLENGWGGTGLDHGLLANEDEPGVTPDTPHGAFFTYYYFTRVFGDVMVPAEVDENDIHVFASRFNSGETGIVLVNPTENDHVVRLAFDGLTLGDRYYWYAVQTDDPNSRKLYVNGVTGTQEGGGPDDYEIVEAFSSTVGEDGEIVIDAPRYGTYYVVVEAQPEAVATEERPDLPDATYVLDVYPNPSHDRVTLQYAVQAAHRVDVHLYDVTGRLVRQLAPAHVLPGTHTADFAVSTLPAGLYLCEIRLDDARVATRKVVVIK